MLRPTRVTLTATRDPPTYVGTRRHDPRPRVHSFGFQMALTIFGSRRTASLAAQFNASSDSSTSDRFDGLPIATWRGRRFVQDELLWKKGSRAPKTWIKDHGVFVREIKRGNASGIGPDHHYVMQRADHGSAERLWVCSICDERRKLETVYSTNATSGAMSHLQNRHRIFPPDGPLTSSDCEDARPRKRPRISPIPKTQSTKVQELACGFIVNTDQPFGVFDDRYLRELLQQFDQDLFSQIPWSRSSQRRQLEVVFDSKKCLVQQSLREAITKIHVAFDLWTSPNRYAIVDVSGHFLDKGVNNNGCWRLLANLGLMLVRTSHTPFGGSWKIGRSKT